ncbi:MAG TPA: glycoside hydrolase family 15 protein [Mycobacteriales bacterium]|nr:glycoside hydrolase family 15 protein [Mycobacteriales bacterium]
MRRDADGFAPIESYAAIGDGRTVALVSTDGRIDWWPVPALDADPTFAALLDPPRGGYIDLAPVDRYESTRRYLPDTNLLETTFTTDLGVVRVIDCLPFGRSGRLAWSELARRVEAISGTVEMRWTIAPGTQLGTAEPWISNRQDSLVIRVAQDQLVVRHFDVGEPTTDGHCATATFTAVPGRPGILAILGTTDAPLFLAERAEIDSHFSITERRWREWAAAIDYNGPWQEEVRRSALALRLLQYVPTGAVAAAATTSLPETIGGDKNWDYRFMWVRDCAFTIDALLTLRLNDEAQAAVQWMLGALRRTEPELQVFYRLDGMPPTAGIDHPDVPGYRASSPVRIGNGAADQQQLGTYGDLLDMIWQYVAAGHCLDPKTARLLAELVDRCCDTWHRKDSGIWELPKRRHYTISKIGCWTALDRAVRLHEAGQLLTDNVERWKRERDAVREWVDEHCWSKERSCYTGYAGTDGLDAATLLMARVGYDRGERLAGTIEAIRKELCDGPVVRRYSGSDDGGGFLACSFWLVHALVQLGDLAEARAVMDEAVTLVNDVGLLSEMYDPSSGAMLGNFPQGLSHLALINAACAYDRAST